MAIINPNIQKILREAGLNNGQSNTQTNGADSDKVQNENREMTRTEALLEAAGLSLEDVLGDLSNIARHGGSEALRLRALETAAKIHGVMKDNNQQQMPIVNIIIRDERGINTENSFEGINPILIPRKLQKKEEEKIQ